MIPERNSKLFVLLPERYIRAEDLERRITTRLSRNARYMEVNCSRSQTSVALFISPVIYGGLRKSRLWVRRKPKMLVYLFLRNESDWFADGI